MVVHRARLYRTPMVFRSLNVQKTRRFRGLGKYGFDMLTHAKSMLVAPPEAAIDHLFPPYTEEKNEALTLWFEY